jgi:type I restriction enzyme S subunit
LDKILIHAWKQRKLGDVFKEYSEKNHAEQPALTIMQGEGTIKREDSERNLLYNKSNLSSYKMVYQDDFIVHLRSFEGGLEKASCNGIVSPAYHIFHGEKADSRFYYSYFRSYEFIKRKLVPHIYGIRDGRSIDIAGMKTIDIPYPSFEEQRRIGDYLDSVNNLITFHHRKSNLFNKTCRNAWEQRKFGDLGSVAMCKRVFKEQTTPVGEIPFYKIGTFGAEPDAFISRELFEEYKSKFQYPNVGDMLISASGTIGRTVEYSGEEAYFQDSNIVWFKHDDRIDNSFLRCIYNIVKWNGIEGSTIKRLYNDNFLKTEFYMPTTGEQAKIGAYFRSLDHLITLHQRKCDEAKKLKKCMLQKMFPKDGEKVPEIRFSGFTGDWKQRKLGEIIEVCSGRDYKHLEKGNVPVYGTGGYMLSVSKALSADKDAVGIGRKGTIDKPYILKAPFWTVDTLFYCVSKEDCDLNFIFDIFQNINWKALDESTGVPSLSKAVINKVKVLIPSVVEQIKIGKYFSLLDNRITFHQQKCDELKNIKKFMLQNMFVSEK